MTEHCRAVIYPKGEGYTLVGRAGHAVAWPRRRQCERKPQANGYCWQHQDLAAAQKRCDDILYKDK